MITALANYKLCLQEHLDDLLERCATETERQAIRGAYQRACEAYNQTVNRILEPGNAQIAQLVSSLDAVQDEVTSAINRLDDIGDIIDKIATGVVVAGKIAMLALPAPH